MATGNLRPQGISGRSSAAESLRDSRRLALPAHSRARSRITTAGTSSLPDRPGMLWARLLPSGPAAGHRQHHAGRRDRKDPARSALADRATGDPATEAATGGARVQEPSHARPPLRRLWSGLGASSHGGRIPAHRGGGRDRGREDGAAGASSRGIVIRRLVCLTRAPREGDAGRCCWPRRTRRARRR